MYCSACWVPAFWVAVASSDVADVVHQMTIEHGALRCMFAQLAMSWSAYVTYSNDILLISRLQSVPVSQVNEEEDAEKEEETIFKTTKGPGLPVLFPLVYVVRRLLSNDATRKERQILFLCHFQWTHTSFSVAPLISAEMESCSAATRRRVRSSYPTQH